MRIAFVAGVLSILSTPAFASPHHHHHYRHHHRHYAHRIHNDHVPVHVARNEGRPADCYGIPWCGCLLRHELGVLDTAFNVARNWLNWGLNAGGPKVGAIVVFPHHVGRIVGGPNNRGQWLVHSGNDGNRIRDRYRSLAEAIGFRTQS